MLNYIKRTFVYQKLKAYKFYKQCRYSNVIKTRRVCYDNKNKAKQLDNMLKRIEINIRRDSLFQSWIDYGLFFINLGFVADNNTPDYSLILLNSIDDLIEKNSEFDNEVSHNNDIILHAILKYLDRIILMIERQLEKESDSLLSQTREIFENMKTKKAETLLEAYQRILFWSTVFWQSRHRLVGVGRLDKILEDIFINDTSSHQDKVNYTKEFLKELHRFYDYKSNDVSLGDTGQMIVLGGVEKDNSYFCNELTYIFLECVKELHLPEPKLLLRVSSKMPNELLEQSIETIASGCGSPLFSNDDVIINSLIDFGYSEYDACNYITSACWEPLSYGNSLEKNNILDINYAKVVVDMYKDTVFEKCASFDELKELFFSKLGGEIETIKKKLDEIVWEYDPLMSFFAQGCLESGKDITRGGTKYSNYGILTVGLANAVNSLCNIREYVFETKKYLLYQIKQAMYNNYENVEIYIDMGKEKKFGCTDKIAVEITKEIMDYVYENLKDYRNCFGGKVKWGLSSSNHVELGKKTGATIDARKAYEPLDVHISNEKNGNVYTDLILFSAQLQPRGNESNGNVVDLIFSPRLMVDNKKKINLFMKKSIELGFFQMQINMVNSGILLDAKMHPDNYTNLIVRVWGYSAYYNDLPEIYKDFLIKRTLEYEGTYT